MKKKLIVFIIIIWCKSLCAQNPIRLDSTIYFFIKNSISDKKSKLIGVKDSIIFLKSTRTIDIINSKSDLVIKRKKLTYILCLTSMKRNILERQGQIEVNYNLQRYIKKRKGQELWQDEGLFIFSIQYNQLNQPIKVFLLNGISPLDLSQPH